MIGRLRFLGGPKCAAALETFPLGEETPPHGIRSEMPMQRTGAEIIALEKRMIDRTANGDDPCAEGFLMALRWQRHEIPTPTVLINFDEHEECCPDEDGGCSHVRPL